MPPEVQDAVAALVTAIVESELTGVTRCQVDISASGIHPFQVLTTEEDVPLGSTAETDPLPEERPSN